MSVVGSNNSESYWWLAHCDDKQPTNAGKSEVQIVDSIQIVMINNSCIHSLSYIPIVDSIQIVMINNPLYW